jgi:hypothetical protein
MHLHKSPRDNEARLAAEEQSGNANIQCFENGSRIANKIAWRRIFTGVSMAR